MSNQYNLNATQPFGCSTQPSSELPYDFLDTGDESPVNSSVHAQQNYPPATQPFDVSATLLPDYYKQTYDHGASSSLHLASATDDAVTSGASLPATQPFHVADEPAAFSNTQPFFPSLDQTFDDGDSRRTLEAPKSPSVGGHSDEEAYEGASDVGKAHEYGSTQNFDFTQRHSGGSNAESISEEPRAPDVASFIDSGDIDLPSEDVLENLAPVSPDDLIQSLDQLEGNEQYRQQRVRSDGEEEVGELIANIFGESDDEEEFEGFAEEDVRNAQALEPVAGSDDEDDEGARSRIPPGESDFDLMMRRKRMENSGRRRRKLKDFVTDADDAIQDLIGQMRDACKADRELNTRKQPALRKRKLLPTILAQLRKQELQPYFIENGIVTTMTEWLSPLPDKSLPALEIRTEFLKMLQQFPSLEVDTLKSSNIGRAVMYLYKHPKETKENKQRAGKLISEWARPIFNLEDDFRSLTKEERESRDYEHMSAAKKRRMSSIDDEHRPAEGTAEQDRNVGLRPGDKGWVNRARVPQPSTRDYVVRPKSNVEGEFKKPSSKRTASARMDRRMREFKERTRQMKAARAVTVNLCGTGMGL